MIKLFGSVSVTLAGKSCMYKKSRNPVMLKESGIWNPTDGGEGDADSGDVDGELSVAVLPRTLADAHTIIIDTI